MDLQWAPQSGKYGQLIALVQLPVNGTTCLVTIDPYSATANSSVTVIRDLGPSSDGQYSDYSGRALHLHPLDLL